MTGKHGNDGGYGAFMGMTMVCGFLGSLGYKHGARVKCPTCGEMAEVW